MSLLKLSCSNFRRSVREYAVLIISLAFSVFIFFNFQNVIYSDAMDVLAKMNKDYIDMVIQAASVVFSVFMLFFTWYATNVFLNQRKKEIGIYIFMGLDNTRIGKMYALEAFFTGMTAWAAGTAAGAGFSKLFQMMLLKMADISADIRFSFSIRPVLITAGVFWLIYGLMIIKGYRSIVKSSVLDLLTGARKEEMKPERPLWAAVKSVLGMAALVSGYICSMHTGEEETLLFALAAVILVIAGIYLLYNGLIPFAVRKMCGNKNYLYQKEHILWVNSLAYRIRKNYRMYAIVTVLMTAAVTVLGTAFAMQHRYDKMVHFQGMYTYQVISFGPELERSEIIQGIEEKNQVEYSNELTILALPSEYFDTIYKNAGYAVVSESQIRQAAEDVGLDWDYPELEQDQAVDLSHVMILSLLSPDKTTVINGKEYDVLATDDTAYLGDLQRSMDITVLSDSQYEELRSCGSEMKIYNFKIADSDNPKNVDASADYIRSLSQQLEDGSYVVGSNIIYPESNEDSYIRVAYSICVFMFVTLILAAGSIIFLKVGNDAREDRERYTILKKIGISEKVLWRSAGKELSFTYYCPFVLMAVSSIFAIRALGSVMREDLTYVNVISALSILILFTLIYLISLRNYGKLAIERRYGYKS